ncbi:MAG: SDR family oxidoreductase [Bacteroidetes bacterium]|nr:SDR family oxidoreductase [Bacteroidota bacterium]
MIADLNGKTALVCGSTAGIGLASARQLAASGARVILLARNEEKLKTTVESLPGGGHGWYTADFADNDSVQDAARRIAAEHVVHILVNNTGGPPAGPAHSANTDDFLAAFRGHLINNHILAQALIPGMKSAGYGRIINIISTSVKIPLPNLGVSNTIRGAVANWSKTLANELAPFGITVNNVLPGATETERLHSIIANKSQKTGLELETVRSEMLHEIPAARFGKPEEPAFAVCFLASPLASYITGTNMVVDGGRTGNL